MTAKTGAPIRAVVVGTGFGCRVHVPALRAAGFEVAALIGTDPARLARRAEMAGVARTFTDLNAAIRATQATVVTIATPPDSHARLALGAIRAGCHVVCEKPMALDAAEGAALLAAAREAGVIHLIGNEFRWQPDRALLGRAIADGLIGAPRLLSMIGFLPLAADPAARLPGWWFDAAAGGGWLGASGSHLIDQAIAWLGPIAAVSAALPTVSARENVAEDSYVIRLTSRSGVEAVLQQTAGAWGPMLSVWRVAGTTGSAWIEQGRVFVADRAGTRELPLPDDLRLPVPADPTSGGRPPSPELAPYTRLCEALHDAITGHPPRTPVPVPTFADGLATMQAMDAVRRSAATGGALVRLDGGHD